MPPTSELWAILAVQAISLSPDKHRHGDDDVVQMGDAAVIGVVGDKDVAGLDVTRLVELLQQHLAPTCRARR